MKGYRLLIRKPDEIYETFPFTLIHGKSFVFENGSFHHKFCFNNDCMLYDPHMENGNTDKVCFNLKFSSKF